MVKVDDDGFDPCLHTVFGLDSAVKPAPPPPLLKIWIGLDLGETVSNDPYIQRSHYIGQLLQFQLYELLSLTSIRDRSQLL